VPLWAGGGTVLVAEQDDAVRRQLATVLAEMGCSVIEAASGDDAVATFARHQDQVRLVVVDIIMPKMSGSEVRSAIHRMRPDARFLFTGPYSRDLLVSTGIIDRQQPYLQKPASRGELADALRASLAS
jgi:CheY-like chemotaxis protein